MKFSELSELRRRGAVEQEPPQEVAGTLLIGEYVATWEDAPSRAGSDRVSVAPCYRDGKQAWMVTRRWMAGEGYTASGVEDEVIDFDAGVTLLLSHGAYEHLFRED